MTTALEAPPHDPGFAGVRKPMPPAQFDALSREILDLKKRLNAVYGAEDSRLPRSVRRLQSRSLPRDTW